MYCKVTLVGNLGRSPEVKKSSGGVPWATLSVATTRRQKQGDAYVNVTEWHAVKVFGREAEWIGRDGAKGSKVIVAGHLETEKWTGKDGTEKQRQVVVASETCRLLERSAPGEAAPDVGAGHFADGSDIPF